MVIELTKDSLKGAIADNDIIIVDFWAPWCGPCRSFAPIYEKAAEANPNICFAKVNTEEEQELASVFNIRSIPTLMVFREQIVLFAQPGAMPEQGLTDLIEKVQALDMDEVRKQIAEAEASAETTGN